MSVTPRLNAYHLKATNSECCCYIEGKLDSEFTMFNAFSRQLIFHALHISTEKISTRVASL